MQITDKIKLSAQLRGRFCGGVIMSNIKGVSPDEEHSNHMIRRPELYLADKDIPSLLSAMMKP